MEKKFEITQLLDTYGGLLSERQRQAAEDFYNFDLSLSEIAENYAITRQAVNDALKTAEKLLVKYEEILGLSGIRKRLVEALAADEGERVRIIEEIMLNA
ncbi:MAG: DNA-binding protein [Firmicutes bacterium]|nr:DNA-binding protein [Bacillota bacterium]